MPSADPLACVVTNGGPLIALPRDIVDRWRGNLPPLGANVPEGWESGDGGIVSDYERACDWPESAFVVDDSWPAWPVSVADRMALVLDGECGTSAVESVDGVVIVRDVGVASHAEIVAAIASLAETDWVDGAFDFDLRSGGLFVFDAAYAGTEREAADGGVMEIAVTPAIYRLRIAYPPVTRRTTFVKLAGAAQDAKKTNRIVIR